MPSGRVFYGREIFQPGVYSKSIFPQSPGISGAPTGNVAIIGSAKGGVPYNASGVDEADRVNVFTTPNDALNILRGGDGYFATEFFLDPTSDENLNTPSKVFFFRVDPASKSGAVAKNGADEIIEIKSVRYGSFANQLAKKIIAGTVSGKKATVKLAGDTIGEKDNISIENFEIQYVGTGSAATMAITATALTTTVTGAATDNLNILFADFPTIGALVKYIDELPAYTCILKGGDDYKTTEMDAVASQDIMTAAYVVKSDVQALINFFNNECSGEITANLKAAAVRKIVDNDTSFSFFTSGSDGSATNTDWANCLALMEKFQINHVIIASGDSAKTSLVAAHCKRMSDIQGKKNRTWFGGSSASTTTKSARIAEAKAFNDARGTYCVTPFYRYDNTAGGSRAVFNGYLHAAMIAGIRSANNLTMTATFKQTKILGSPESYSSLDKDDYIKNGCTVVHQNENGLFEILHHVSTYQGSNYILNLPSALDTCDFITQDSQIKLKNRIAAMTQAPDDLMIADLLNYILVILLPGYRDQKLITDNPQTGQKAFSDVEFKIEGDAFLLSFTAIVVLPLHYGFVTQRFTVIG